MSADENRKRIQSWETDRFPESFDAGVVILFAVGVLFVILL